MQEALVLRSSDRRPSPGLLITFRDQRDEQVRVVRVDAEENPIGEPIVLVDSFKVMVQGLWVQVQRTIRDLVLHRRHVEWATLNGKSVLELDRPVGLVRALVSAIAPWVRNIRRRSRARGAMELVQQRNDGSNQQLIISYYELVRKYRHLSPQHRSMFDAYGIAPTGKTRSRSRPRYDHVASVPTAEPSAPHQPKISGVHPAAPSQPAPSSPSQPLYQLPPPSAPPRPRPSETVARSEGLPPTIPPPPPEAYLPRRLPPTIPPRLPEAYAVGAPPPTIRPPAAGARRDAELTRPALRVVRGGR
jgi:hypothetical protein